MCKSSVVIEKKPILSWDTLELSNDRINYLIEDGGLTKEEAEKQMDDDLYLFDFEWKDLVDNLTNILHKINPNNKTWCVRIINFGRRNLNGIMEFNSLEGREFLHEILPKCECTFSVYLEGTNLSINNFHHDSPLGEWYYIEIKD